jgi:hypothetical protein
MCSPYSFGGNDVSEELLIFPISDQRISDSIKSPMHTSSFVGTQALDRHIDQKAFQSL